MAKGALPDDGCTRIAETEQGYGGNRFDIILRTEKRSDASCSQAITSFEESISLKVEGLKTGNYTVNVNGIEETFELQKDNILLEEHTCTLEQKNATMCIQIYKPVCGWFDPAKI